MSLGLHEVQFGNRLLTVQVLILLGRGNGVRGRLRGPRSLTLKPVYPEIVSGVGRNRRTRTGVHPKPLGSDSARSSVNFSSRTGMEVSKTTSSETDKLFVRVTKTLFPSHLGVILTKKDN